MGDVLIHGGLLVDGTGEPARRADLRIRDGVISQIAEHLDVEEGERVVDASGCYVTPGFIDTHTHFDPQLFWDSYADPIPAHGVTTVLAGNCGLSLAPVRPEHVKVLSETFCYIEDLSTEAFETQIPFNWETYAEYLDALEGDGLGVDVATLVGHSVLRLYGAGDAAWERASNDDERAAISQALQDCLEQGAFGVSTSMGFDTHPILGPVPSRLADDAELEALCDVMAEHDALLQFLPGLSSTALHDMVPKVAGLVEPRGLRATYIGIFHVNEAPGNATMFLDQAKDLQDRGVRLYPQVSPRQLDIRANWDGGMGFAKLEQGWMRYVQATREEKAAIIVDPEWRAIAREEWDRVGNNFIPHRHPERIRLLDAVSDENQRWVGKTLADLVAERGGHPSDVLADWVAENDLVPGILGVGVSNSDPEGVAGVLTHPAAFISNSDAGAHLGMMCASGDTTLLLSRFVRDRKDMTIEHAVNALTARQAELLGLSDRGILAEGLRADVNVFALDELEWKTDEFLDDFPGGDKRLRRPAGGFRVTFLNGEVTCEAGEDTGNRPGRVLRAGALV